MKNYSTINDSTQWFKTSNIYTELTASMSFIRMNANKYYGTEKKPDNH